MKRTICLLAVISLLIALAGVIGYNEGKGSVEGNSPEAEGSPTVVQMNGKELSVGAPYIGANSRVSVLVKNSSGESITVAQVKLEPYKRNGSSLGGYPWKGHSVITIKDLLPGEVQLLYWYLYEGDQWGSFMAKVETLE